MAALYAIAGLSLLEGWFPAKPPAQCEPEPLRPPPGGADAPDGKVDAAG